MWKSCWEDEMNVPSHSWQCLTLESMETARELGRQGWHQIQKEDIKQTAMEAWVERGGESVPGGGCSTATGLGAEIWRVSREVVGAGMCRRALSP